MFWVKSIFGNAFPYLQVFGCARKMHFPEMFFSWPLNGCKLISVSILPSNSHFPENRERAEGEGDAPARRERERERGRRERGRSVRRAKSNPFDFAVRLREPRSRTQIANPDREPRSQHRFVILDREPRSVAPQNRSSSTPKPIVLPPFFSQFDRIMIFFFLGFICVSV